MIIAAHQPQYMPWLGYFDKLAQSDHFVLLDTVQFKKNEWQNRNRIKSARGWQWLTVPVSFRFPEKIAEVSINNQGQWQKAHNQSLITNYHKAPFFDWVMSFWQEIYDRSWKNIAELNIHIIKKLTSMLDIKTRIHVASELGEFPAGPDERLIALVRHFGGKTYLAGSGGKQYMDMKKWQTAGVDVTFQEYNHPVYPQLFGSFESNLSILDLLFNCGPKSIATLRGTQ